MLLPLVISTMTAKVMQQLLLMFLLMLILLKIMRLLAKLVLRLVKLQPRARLHWLQPK